MRLGQMDCDLLVVGGGTAGLVGAKTAAGFGARVILVERERTGGDCLWTGCVPSKSLIAAARTVAEGRGGASRIDSSTTAGSSFPDVMEQVRAAIATIAPVDSPEALESAGVTVITGDIRFTGRNTAMAGDRELTFRQALIVTGAAPAIPPLDGLDQIEALTSQTVWGLSTLPDRLLILGGGPIGCELGQAFARLGAAVTIVSRADRLLSREDPRASRIVAAALQADGVELRLSATATRVQLGADGNGQVMTLGDGSVVPFDALLVATGKRPRTNDLGLDVVGVRLGDRGHIAVDDHLQTSNPWIWAAGDVTARSSHTHTAGMHGSIAASNAILGLRRTIDTRAVPRVTFTSPEVAAVGVSTADERTPPSGRVLHMDHEHVDRAVTDRATAGFSRLAVNRKGVIVGATIVSPRAGETLGEVTLAIHQRLKVRDIAATTHAYPTFNDSVWNAAVADVQASLGSTPVSVGIGLLRSVRRAWVGWRQRNAR